MMQFALSTHWNASRHKAGEAMIAEILNLGIDKVELGYDLTLDLVPGVMKMVKDGSVTVDSIHNFCPVPVGAPFGHPELFQLSALDPGMRETAVRYTLKTVIFAAETGARTVVIHAGNVDMKNLTIQLLDLCNRGDQYSPKYEKTKLKLLMKREDLVQKHLESLYRSIDEMLPELAKFGVRIAFENLPSWESIPCESEMEAILRKYQSPLVGYWHDTGHGQIRQNLGFISYRLWLDKLIANTFGFHIHDVEPPARDHLMPPHGHMDLGAFKNYIKPDMALVLEPAPHTPEAEIREGMRIISAAWAQPGTQEGI